MARGLFLTQPFPLNVQLYVILHNNNSGLWVVLPVINDLFSAIGYYYWSNRYIIVESDISDKLQF